LRQNRAPEGQSATVAHWTHASFEQIGVAVGHWLPTRQATQAPSGSQNLPLCEAQSVLAPHSTQPALATLQTGVDPEHWASDVHPSTHTKRPGSQIGLAIPQSALLRHATQVLVAGSQSGSVIGQSVLAPHSTHASVAASQMGVGIEHCESVMQPTHAPTAVWQIGSAFGQSESVVHAA
jgi:hypothetical protein